MSTRVKVLASVTALLMALAMPGFASAQEAPAVLLPLEGERVASLLGLGLRCLVDGRVKDIDKDHRGHIKQRKLRFHELAERVLGKEIIYRIANKTVTVQRA